MAIGCERHSIEYWLENYDIIAKKYCYTDDEIAEYKAILDMLKVIFELENKGNKENEDK